MNKNTWILVVIVVLIVGGMIGLAILLKSSSPDQVTADPNITGEQVLVRETSHMTGQLKAKVILVEFGDFQCGYCAEANPAVQQVVEKYKSNPEFNFVYRHFPLAQHNHAIVSAQAAEAAGEQGKFWDMEKILYANQNDWAGTISPVNKFVEYAGQLGLDVERFRNEVAASQYINVITQDKKDAEALGVNSTPTFFLNGQKLDGYSTLDSQIAQLLGQ
jgi:protein-disulfide isomerase